MTYPTAPDPSTGAGEREPVPHQGVAPAWASRAPVLTPGATPGAEPAPQPAGPDPRPADPDLWPSRVDPGHVPHAHRAAPATEPSPRTARRRRRLGRLLVALLVVLLIGASAVGVRLYRTSQAWEERSQAYLDASEGLGVDLAASRAELAGSQSELEAVRAQLATAQARIVELADEKARLGDDREVQLQLVDYQERVSEAAGRVALALDQCVQGQNRLIGYLKNSAAYDPAELEQYGEDVQVLCETATEANAALQVELSR